MFDKLALDIVQTMRDPLLILDKNLHVLMVNHAFFETFQVTPGETEGRFVYELGSGQWDIPRLRQLLEAVIAQQTTVEAFEVEHEFPRIGQRTMLLNARRVIQSEAEDDLILLIIEDITERRKAEGAFAAQAKELARSNADLQQFAYVASHDLQEPLRMVTSYLKLIERRYKGKLDDDADEFITFAVDGGRRMQVLIDDLLSYARIGTRGGSFEPLDCEKILETVLADLTLAIHESGSIVSYDPLPTVVCDASRIAQVFRNLVSNAVKFRRDVPLEVHVSAERQGAEWLFRVSDNGIGIQPEFSERIFVIFQRLNRRGDYPGTGIGLAICKKIIERHGGRIWVESQYGQGSTFYFTLPVSREGIS